MKNPANEAMKDSRDRALGNGIFIGGGVGILAMAAVLRFRLEGWLALNIPGYITAAPGWWKVAFWGIFTTGIIFIVIGAGREAYQRKRETR
jgi:hypothetical protein